MTVFCPNCGKPNTNEASKCASCGKEIKKSGGAKFKGTMMMTGGPAGAPPPAEPDKQPPQNKGQHQGQGASEQPPAPAAPFTPAQPPLSPTGDSPPAKGSETAGGSSGSKNLAFQKTMMGPMVPPPGGPSAPEAGAAPPPPSPSAPTVPERPGVEWSEEAPSRSGEQPLPGQGGESQSGSGTASFGSAPPPAHPTPPTSGGPGVWGLSSPARGTPPVAGAEAGGPAGAEPSGPPTPGAGGADKKSRVWWWVGGGCLAFLLFGCVAFFVFLDMASDLWSRFAINQKTNEIAAAAKRLPLTVTLTNLHQNCQLDPSGAGNAELLIDGAGEALRASACEVDREVVAAFSDPERSHIESLEQANHESLADRFQVDPEQCYQFTSGEAKIVACSLDNGLKIAKLENLKAVHPSEAK